MKSLSTAGCALLMIGCMGRMPPAKGIDPAAGRIAQDPSARHLPGLKMPETAEVTKNRTGVATAGTVINRGGKDLSRVVIAVSAICSFVLVAIALSYYRKTDKGEEGDGTARAASGTSLATSKLTPAGLPARSAHPAGSSRPGSLACPPPRQVSGDRR
jgi:hypothetical protein